MEPCTKDGLKHYSVTSPPVSYTIYHGEGLNEPGESPCWVQVLAEDPVKAKAIALRDKDFEDWLKSLGRWENPFKGIVVHRFTCKGRHVCLGCKEECEECELDFKNDAYYKDVVKDIILGDKD